MIFKILAARGLHMLEKGSGISYMVTCDLRQMYLPAFYLFLPLILDLWMFEIGQMGARPDHMLAPVPWG